MDSRLPWALACCLALSALAPIGAEATTFYVRKSGSDAANGLTPATAFATIRRAADSILNPGDRVVVGPGTYAEGDLLPANNGIANRPVVFFADTSGAETTDAPGAVVIAPGSAAMTGFVLLGKRGVTIDGFRIQGAADSCLQVRPSADGAVASRDIVVRNLRVTGCAKRGIDIVAAGSVTVEDCHASGNITGISVAGHGGVGSSAALGRPDLTLRDNEVVTNNGDGIYLERVTGYAMGNVVFDNGLAGIQLRSSSGVVVLENDVRRNGEGGIVVGKGFIDAAVGDVRLEANRIEDNVGGAVDAVVTGIFEALGNTIPAPRGTGIYVDGRGVGAVQIEGNQISAANPDAVFLTEVASGEVVGNQISDAVEQGIELRGGSSLRVAANAFFRTGTNAIQLEADGVVTVEENVIETVGGPAVSVASPDGSVMATVRDNMIDGAESHGVRIAGAAAGSVALNRIADVGGHGVLVDSSSDVSVSANTIDRVVFAGVRARSSSDLAILDNEIAFAGDGGVGLETAGVVEVRRNRVSQTDDPGIGVTATDPGTESFVTDNVVTDVDSDGLLVTGTSYAALHRNRVERCNGAGASLPGVGDTVVADNVLLDNAQNGLRVTGSGTVAASGNELARNGEAGIRIEADPGRSFAIDVAENRITTPIQGIFVRGCAGGRVAGNHLNDATMDGILLRFCTGVDVADNEIRNAGRNAIAINTADEAVGGDIRVRHNLVAGAGDNGISVYARGTVVAVANDVRDVASSGLSIITDGRARVIESNNVIRRAGAHGAFVRGADRGLIQNSVLHTNADTGVTLRSSSDMLVANNLIYANGTDGLAIGTGGGASPRATVTNNTIYANGARGFVLGSGGVASPGARFFNNIVEANGGIGLAVDRLSAEGFVAGFNVNSDGYGEDTPVSAFDVLGPAGFIAPAGADGTLGGTAAADDDFRLQQVRGGQASDAIAVDAGSADAAAIGLTGTTAVNGVADIDRIDAGFHYDATLAQLVQLPPAYMPLYVNAEGDDGNDGRTRETSLRSIRRAGILAASGATVIVAPGRYVEPEPIRVRQGAAAVTFLADASGERSSRPPGPVVIDADGGDNAFVLLDADDVTIDGFHVTNSATAAIQVRDGADRATVRNNVVFSNAKRGIEIRSADAGLLTNNLVYANGTGGIQLQATRGSEVSGNTVYGNGENGITVGGSAVTVGRLDRAHGAGESVLEIRLASVDASTRLDVGDVLEIGSRGGRYRVTSDATAELGLLSVAIDPPLFATQSRDTSVTDQTLAALDTRVVRNVVAANNLGILAQSNSLAGYECGGNVVADGLPGLTPRCDSDILAAPQFVDPQGADGILGGTGFADDDFRLWQDLSPAVDLTLCTDELSPPAGTTDPAGFPDECPIDSGFHYPEFALAAIE